MSVNTAKIDLPNELSSLSTAIDEKPESFASGDAAIRDAALHAAKFIFDLTVKSEGKARPYISALLSNLSQAEGPQTRSQARAAGTASNTPKPPKISDAILNPTPLTSLYIESMEEDQVWAQLELKAKNVCETLEKVFDSSNMDPMNDADVRDKDKDNVGMDVDGSSDEDDFDSEEFELEGMEGMDFEDEDEDEDEEEDSGEDDLEEEQEDGADEDLGEGVADLRDPSSDEDDSMEESSSTKHRMSKSRKAKTQSELDDEVFNLEEFNKETLQAESLWSSKGSLSRDEAQQEEDSDEEVPIDYFASFDDAEAADGQDMDKVAGDVFYEDFFGPLPRNARKKGKKTPIMTRGKSSKVRFHEEVKVKNIKSSGKGLPLSVMNSLTPSLMRGSLGDGKAKGKMEGSDDDSEESEEGDDEENEEEEEEDDDGDDDEDEDEGPDEEDADVEDGRMAVERSKDDLFAEDDETEESQKTGLSSHKKQMEEIRKQIAALEAENVGKKDWVLSGEVNARGRPENALLEQVLDFEQISKPVPVVTEEVVQDLETRIKARIVEGRFDDVVRRRPVDDRPFMPSKFFELQDTKSKDSLAQIYEKEYMASQGGAPLDDRDGKLKKEHDEIDKAWESISYKLDALCNAHFTPKQPKAVISTVTNAAAVALESALPTAQSTSTILAPEEVYAAGSSALQTRSEMTPAEKRTARSRDRKHKQRQRQRLAVGVDSFAHMNGVKKAKGVKEQKEAAMKSIVKHGKGVTVIGKKDIPGGKKKTKT